MRCVTYRGLLSILVPVALCVIIPLALSYAPGNSNKQDQVYYQSAEGAAGFSYATADTKKGKEEQYIDMLNRTAADRQVDISDPFKIIETHKRIFRHCEKEHGDVEVGDFGCVAMTRISIARPEYRTRKPFDFLESCARFVPTFKVKEELLIPSEVTERFSIVMNAERVKKTKKESLQGIEGIANTTGAEDATSEGTDEEAGTKPPVAGSRGTLRQGLYGGDNGWKILRIDQALHYLNKNSNSWPGEVAYVYSKNVGAYVEIHKIRNRNDQAAARSRSALARRAESAESEAEVWRQEVAKVKAEAEKSIEKARKDAMEMVRKETRAREEQAQKLWRELQEVKAAVFNSGSEEKVTE